MNKSSLYLIALAAAALNLSPARTFAETIPVAPETSAPAVEKAKPAKPATTPFHGKLTAVDKVQMTIAIDDHTYYITSSTRLKKNGKPAIFSDAAVGDAVNGNYKTSEDGRMLATRVTIGEEKVAKPAKPAEAPAKPATAAGEM